MQWSLEPPGDDGVGRVLVSGEATVDEGSAMLRDVESAIDAFDVRAMLFDTNGLKLDTIRSDEVQRIASMWQRSPVLARVPVAYIQADPVVYGVIRQVIAWRETDNARVFRTEGEALSWLAS